MKTCRCSETTFIPAGSMPMNVLTKDGTVAILAQNLIRVTARFFSGVLHPHLLGVCCPNLSFLRGAVRMADASKTFPHFWVAL